MKIRIHHLLHCRTVAPACLAVTAGLVLVLALSPWTALAAAQITAARLEYENNHTDLVLEAKTPIQYKMYSQAKPEHVVLDLADVTINTVLSRLMNKVGPGHPHLERLQIGQQSSQAVRLVLVLKPGVKAGISTLKSGGRRGYRLVVNLYSEQPVRAPAVRTPAPESAAREKTSAVKSHPPATRNLSSQVNDGNLLLLQARLDRHILSDAIPVYQDGDNIYLPLGELAALLGVAIRTQPEQGTAGGFVLHEDRTFSLNAANGTVTLAGRTKTVDPGLLKVKTDDIYVASELIIRWLPLDFDIILSTMSLQLRPRVLLPVQARLEREQRGRQAGVRGEYKDPGYPRRASPYRLAGLPVIDQTMRVDFRRGSEGAARTDSHYSAYLAADLLGMESALFIRTSTREPSHDFRWTLGRHDPDAGLLGPLRARSFLLGSTPVPGVANIARTAPVGNGVTVSNRPLSRSSGFGSHSLQGELPSGWDVELYFNDALVGYQQARSDGKYTFDGQQLQYGANEFRLVFRGPFGQVREERERFLLDQSVMPPGEFYYSITEHRDKNDRPRTVAQFDWGLSRHFSATGGFTRLPVAGVEQRYGNLGLRSSWQSVIFSGDFARSDNEGSLVDWGIRTGGRGFSLGINRTLLDDFTSDLFLPGSDPIRSRDKIRVDGLVPLGFPARLPLTVEAARDRLQSGAENSEASARLSVFLYRTSFTGHVRRQSFGNARSTEAGLQLSRRAGGIGLRGQIDYMLKPESEPMALTLSADKHLAPGYFFNLGLTRLFAVSETFYTAGLNKNLGRFGLGFSTSYSSRGEFVAGLQLFLSIGREPGKQEWLFDAQSNADTGAASVRVFLDKNMNGVMDTGDEPINNAGLSVNGAGNRARTDAAGIVHLGRLQAKQHVDIALDTATLEDPQWMPQLKGVRLVPRPGHVMQLDFPVIMTGEIDGTVYQAGKDGKRGMGNIAIELVDHKGETVAATRTAWDGYYIIPAVRPGDYSVRISPQQMRELNLKGTGTRRITMMPDGTFINGIDFSVRTVAVKEANVPSR